MKTDNEYRLHIILSLITFWQYSITNTCATVTICTHNLNNIFNNFAIVILELFLFNR